VGYCPFQLKIQRGKRVTEREADTAERKRGQETEEAERKKMYRQRETDIKIAVQYY
jgi:hypothetical protein